MTPGDEIRKARLDARVHRTAFFSSLADTRHRLTPGELGKDAKYAAGRALQAGKTGASDAVKAHPVIVGTAIAGFLAFLFRKPIGRAARRVEHRLSERGHGTARKTLASARIWIENAYRRVISPTDNGGHDG